MQSMRLQYGSVDSKKTYEPSSLPTPPGNWPAFDILLSGGGKWQTIVQLAHTIQNCYDGGVGKEQMPTHGIASNYIL